jgi:hypothetical protein
VSVLGTVGQTVLWSSSSWDLDDGGAGPRAGLTQLFGAGSPLDQFDCGTVPGWKISCSGRIFQEWRQLSDAIAVPSTNALKISSWHRIRVARSAELRWRLGGKASTFPHSNLLNVQTESRNDQPSKRPRDTNQLAKSIIDIATKTKNLDDDGPLQDMKLPHHADEGSRPSRAASLRSKRPRVADPEA